MPATDFPGIDGFLGTRASFGLDLVAVVLVGLIPTLAYSIWVIRKKRDFGLHKRLQLGLSITLLTAITIFEIDLRFLSGWEERAQPSPYFDGPDGGRGWVGIVLYTHLVFAISTTLLWLFVVPRALRRFPRPPGPNEHSPSHIFWARLAAFDMFVTGITGWTFYWIAFVA